MLKRRFEEELPYPSAVDPLSFKELIREGFKRGYIEKPEDWFLFREHRNIALLTYHESTAQVVFTSAVRLNGIARALDEGSRSRNVGSSDSS
jgi:hypothetical protein